VAGDRCCCSKYPTNRRRSPVDVSNASAPLSRLASARSRCTSGLSRLCGAARKACSHSRRTSRLPIHRRSIGRCDSGATCDVPRDDGLSRSISRISAPRGIRTPTRWFVSTQSSNVDQGEKLLPYKGICVGYRWVMRMGFGYIVVVKWSWIVLRWPYELGLRMRLRRAKQAVVSWRWSVSPNAWQPRNHWPVGAWRSLTVDARYRSFLKFLRAFADCTRSRRVHG